MEILIHNLSHSDIVFELLSYRSSSSSSGSSSSSSGSNNGEIYDYDNVIMTRPKFSSFQIVTQHIYNHICSNNNNNSNDIDSTNNNTDHNNNHHHYDYNSRSSMDLSRRNNVVGIINQQNYINNDNDISSIKNSREAPVHNINADIVNDDENNDDDDVDDINNEQHQQQQQQPSHHHHYSSYIHNNLMDIDLIMTKLHSRSRRKDNDGQRQE